MSVLLLLLVARTAAATPLEPLWESKVACTRHDLVAAGDSLAWIDGNTIQRIDRARPLGDAHVQTDNRGRFAITVDARAP